VGKIRLNDFLAQKVKPKPGKIVDTNGKVLGKHNGLHTFTIGQRHGIKIASSTPYYVAKKDLKNNLLIVTQNPNDPLLYTKQVELISLHLINLLPKNSTVVTRFRHQGQLVEGELELKSKHKAVVSFKEPQKALASGQSIVLYQKNICLGGGIIK
jgi:tRNA-specific 2-thiouridylase